MTYRREAVRLQRLTGSALGASRVDSSVTWHIDTSWAGRMPRFAHITKGRDTEPGGGRSQATNAGSGSGEVTNDNEGMV